MSFSSRRRNYLLTPHRRDSLIEWMKAMLQHSFVLDALDTTGADTFEHFEMLIDEHRRLEAAGKQLSQSNGDCKEPQPSRLKQLVPTIGVFHTPLPLREAFEVYNEKHQITKRKHIAVSFNEIRHILNLAQIMALRKENTGTVDGNGSMENAGSLLNSITAIRSDDLSDQGSPKQLNGPSLITFDGDQTLYSDGANFESNPRLANYLYLLLRHGVSIAVVTAAGYEYNTEKYEYRLSGLLHYFQSRGLSEDECHRFYLFGGECNYLLQLGPDYRLHPIKETGPGSWMTSTKFLPNAPGNWEESDVTALLDTAEAQVTKTLEELKLRGRVIRKRRAVGLVPKPGSEITRESLDETVLRIHEELAKMNGRRGPTLPYCAFNGGNDMWVDVGNKRVGVEVLQHYLGIPPVESLHIGDQFLNTGNDYAARSVSPCIWIVSPTETTYILKSILRLAGVDVALPDDPIKDEEDEPAQVTKPIGKSEDNEGGGMQEINSMVRRESLINFEEAERRVAVAKTMDVYTGEIIKS